MAEVVEALVLALALVLGKLLESSFSLFLNGAAPPACLEAGLREVARLGATRGCHGRLWLPWALSSSRNCL